MSTLKLCQLTADLFPAYNEFVSKTEASFLYHSSKYHLLLSRLVQEKVETIVAVRGHENIVGAISYVKKEGRFGTVLNSLPFFGSHGDILGFDEDAIRALAYFYNDVVLSTEIASAVLVTNPLIQRPLTQLLGESLDYRLTHLTPLHLSSGEVRTAECDLLSQFHQKTRNAIRKAIKNNIVIEETTDFSLLEQLHIQTMQSVKGKAKPHDFFLAVPEIFTWKDDYKLFIASQDRKIIAALLCFYWRDMVEYYMPAADPHYRDLQPLSYLIFNAMIDASQSGYTTWNWGGTWPEQDSLYRFKSRWGAKDRRYEYLCYIRSADILAASPIELGNEYPYFYVAPYRLLRSNPF